MRRIRLFAALAALLIAAAPAPAWCWSNHGLLTYWAFKDAPEVAGAPDVVVEPLDAFLRDQEQAVADLLAAQEVWARANAPTYPPRPDELAFKADASRDAAARQRAFSEALRIAADTRFALFAQALPGVAPPVARPMRFGEVSTLREPAFSMMRFYRLEPGEKVVVLPGPPTSAREPDLRTQHNCWEDSPSEWGKRYKLGKLPFGNPALDFNTQAPFHMGFYHQSWLIYRAAPFVARTYPMVRVHQFMGLSRLAFGANHAYWGWRFAAMAMHYVQDLTQPYHASLLPGVSTLRMIAINSVDMLGWHGPKNAMIVLASNRHLALERYEALLIYRDTAAGGGSPLIEAVQAKARDGLYPAWSDFYLRDVVTQESFDYGERLNAALLTAFPAKYVADPAYDFGASGGSGDLIAEVAGRKPEERAPIEDAIRELIGHFGAHSRNLVRAIGAGRE